MKKLFASCAAMALMAGPVLAQGTYDPTNRDQVPVDPAATGEIDPAITDGQDMPPPVADELPQESDATASTDTMSEDEDPVLQADTDDGGQTMAEAEPSAFDAGAGMDVLEASINVDELPADYSTDDLNALMMAEVNNVGTEISGMNIDANDDGFVPEGQGDIDTPAEDMTPAPEQEGFTTPDTDGGTDDHIMPGNEAPEADNWMEPDPL